VDNLVLIRVAAQLRRTLVQAVVQEVRVEAPWRFRLRLLQGESRRSVVISLDPRQPWIGRPSGLWRVRGRSASTFAGAASRALHGAVLTGLDKPAAERRVTFRFAGGRALVVELYPHAANLVLLDSEGRVESTARRPGRKQRTRLAAGQPYAPREAPPRQIDPFGASVERIRAGLDSGASAGLSDEEKLTRGFLGIGPVGASLLVGQARREARELAVVVVDRLSELLEGAADPLIESPSDPAVSVIRGGFDPEACRLLAWTPAVPVVEPLQRFQLDGPDATAGLYHDALERNRVERLRARSLLAILEREIGHMRDVEAKVAVDLESFGDPARYRHWGEALLAGLHQARRVGEHVIVPDPYDPARAPLAVPVPAERSPTQAADRLFARHRRAERGRERARQRASEVAGRRERLERIRREQAGQDDPDSAETLEQAMQREGIPVGLEPAAGKYRDAVRTSVPRIEGVRLFSSADGDAVLVGKSGRDNHRLTFKLATPEDFWLHALGVPGAHVVVRNERREKRPSRKTLIEAAEAAAWFSEAREETQVDVQWTRRKYVRRLRGAPLGTVTVKRAETLRVRPRCPTALAGGRR